MIEYLLLKEDGTIVQRGKSLSKADIPRLPGMRIQIISGNDLRQPEQPPVPTYAAYRAMDYPSIGDQLDALWKVIDGAGIAELGSPELREMLDRVKEVKARHPKDIE